ncbi:hypothetical protein ACLESD_04860 [Pyxidicoccus sp. 3LFB2]
MMKLPFAGEVLMQQRMEVPVKASLQLAMSLQSSARSGLNV